MKRLLEILTYRRPHESASEAAFIEKFLHPLADHPNVSTYSTDAVGNIYVLTYGDSHTLFSCHTDTVHRVSGMQEIDYDELSGYALLAHPAPAAQWGTSVKFAQHTTTEDIDITIDTKGMTLLDTGKYSNCLGADDGAGIWLLLHMIDNGIPGLYVFWRGEERGGIGSRFAASDPVLSKLLSQYHRAIAFDRKADCSVITYQGMSRCCSDMFAKTLARELNMSSSPALTLKPDDSGVFTDTANLTGLIAECTNVSCGYYNEHTSDEYLDVSWLMLLADAVVSINWETLPTERKPGEVDDLYSDWRNDYNWSGDWRSGHATQTSNLLDMPDVDEMVEMSYTDVEKWIDNSSVREVIETVMDMAWRIQELKDELTEMQSLVYTDDVYEEE